MEQILEYLLKNYRKILGAIFGFVFGMIAVKYGIWAAVSVMVLTAMGYLFGDSIFKLNLRRWIIDKLTEGEDN
jgi:Na+-transporting NADH:ubiquinone oxidoreductase subunit NqrE